MKSKKPVLYHRLAPERWPVYDPPVYVKKSVFMQRIVDMVTRGHSKQTGGETTDEKVWKLTQKLARVYEVNIDRNERARRRKAKKGTAVLLLWRSGPGKIRWLLLVTRTGEHRANQLEELKDAFQPQGRITFTGYELVRLPKPAPKPGSRIPKRARLKNKERESSVTKHAKKQSGGTTLTWRMTAQNYQNWRQRAIDTARMGNAREVDQFLDVLYGTPGFRGCRFQVGKIMALFRAEWRRVRSDKEPLPEDRPLYYTRRLPDATVSLRALMKQTRKAERAGAAAAEAYAKAQAELDIDQLPPVDPSKLVNGLPRLTALVEKAQAEVPVKKVEEEVTA
jgi:hypothetical protein